MLSVDHRHRAGSLYTSVVFAALSMACGRVGYETSSSDAPHEERELSSGAAAASWGNALLTVRLFNPEGNRLYEYANTGPGAIGQ